MQIYNPKDFVKFDWSECSQLVPIRQCVSPLHSEGRYYHRFVVGQHGDYVCWIDFSRLDFCTAPIQLLYDFLQFSRTASPAM